MSREVRALTVDDARALKLAIAVAIGEPITPGQNQLIDELGDVDTPHENFETTLNKLSRLEVNQQRLWKIDQAGKEPERTIEFEWLIDDRHIPGGRTALVRALYIRLCRLIGTPIPEDERGNDIGTLAKAAIDEIAATVQIGEREQSVH